MQKDYLKEMIKVLKNSMPEKSKFTMGRIHITQGKKVSMSPGAMLTFAPFFKKLGFKLSKLVVRFGEEKGTKFRGLQYKTFIDMKALRELFDLDFDQTLWIFGPARKGNQADVIKRINQVLKNKNPSIHAKENVPEEENVSV